MSVEFTIATPEQMQQASDDADAAALSALAAEASAQAAADAVDIAVAPILQEVDGVTRRVDMALLLVTPSLVTDSIAEPIFTAPNTSTFSGWGSAIGSRQYLKGVSFYIRAWNSSSPVTQVRFQLRENDYTGAVLVDKLVSVSVPSSTAEVLVTVTFDDRVENAANTRLWGMFWCNGLCGTKYVDSDTAYPEASGYPRSRYSTSASTSSLTTLASSIPRTVYFRLSSDNVAGEYVAPTAGFSERMGSSLGISDLGKSAALLTGVASPAYTNTASYEAAPLSAAVEKYNSSTFSGWAGPVGVAQNVDRVEFYVRSWTSALPVTSVRVVIRDTDATGVVLAEKTVPVSVATNVSTRLSVVLDDRLVNAGLRPLWVEFLTNGRTGVFVVSQTTYLPTPTYPKGRYSTSANPGASTTGQISAAEIPYFFLATVDRLHPVAVPTAAFSAAVITGAGLAPRDYDAEFLPSVPPVVYLTEGVETNIYADNVAYFEGNSGPVVEFVCTKGAQLAECWRFTPVAADATDGLAMSVNLRAAGAVRATKAVTLRVTARTAAARSIAVCCIGDSTTQAGDYTARVLALEASDPNTAVTLVGTQGSGSNKHEGRGGWSIARYNGEEPAFPSPFVFSGAFNFGQYLSTNSLATPDAVTVGLGINDVFGRTGDTEAQTTAFAQLSMTKLEAWITSIKAANPAVKIGILTVIPPAAEASAFGLQGNYSRQGYLRRRFLLLRVMLAQFAGREDAGIFLIGSGHSVDTLRGFPRLAAAPAFAHTAETVSRQYNHVHPSTPGYYQIGDAVWAFLKWAFR